MRKLDGRLKVIEVVDKYTFFNYLLPGLVYLSQGIPYRVVRVEKEGKRWLAYAVQEKEVVNTYPLHEEKIEVVEVFKEKTVFNFVKVKLAKIKVVKEYYGYFDEALQRTIFYEEPYTYEFSPNSLIIEIPMKMIESVPLEEYTYFLNKLKKADKKWKEYLELVEGLDPLQFYNKYRGLATKKLYETLQKIVPGKDKKKAQIRFYLKKIVDSKEALRMGLHAIEHNLIKISPILTNVDSRELGGYSMISQGVPLIFIYEAYEGGVGLVDLLYEKIEDLLRFSLNRLTNCKCKDGCPSCIFSPKCGNANQLLDKYAARFILKRIIPTKSESE